MTGPKSTQSPPRAEAGASRRVRDPYADLLRDTRALRRDHAAARDAWYAGLAVDRKEECLFELEMLLKGLGQWANTRNHPSTGGRDPLYVRNFRPQLAVARAVLRRCHALCGVLLGPQRAAAPAVARHLPPGFTDEPRGDRGEAAETPEAALESLRQALAVSAEITDGLLRVDHVPYRLFYAALAAVQREVSRNPFFNPLFTLEFRPEFDRVRVPDVLDAILSVDGETAHRLVALACVGALRLLRMTGLLRALSADRSGIPLAWALLTAVRADALALARVLGERAPAMLADTLERDLMRVPATDVRNRYEVVARDCERLRRLRSVLLASGASLRAEARRLTEVRVPPCDAMSPPDEVAAAFEVACEKLRDALQGVVLSVTRALRGSADPERLFGDRAARRSAAERLRQGAWMFTVVTRAFLSRARAADTSDTWSAGPNLGFVGEYLAYFRSIGAALALETDYPHAERLSQTLAGLRESDWIDAARLARAAEECEAFVAHLHDVIDRAGRRDDLRGVALDKAAAGETLKMYLGA